MAAYPSTTTAVATAPAVVPSAGGAKLIFIEKTFDLDALITGKIANADIINLMTLPANFVVLATKLTTTVINVGAGGTSTLKLRFGTTDIGAATDMLTAATGVGGNATVLLPLSVGTSAVLLNVVAAVGSGTTTRNPTIKVTVVGVDMS